MSITYSPNITGSLYVNAIEGTPYFLARVTTSSGEAERELTLSIFDLEIDQFWQNLQPRLHPAVPKLNIPVPGKK